MATTVFLLARRWRPSSNQTRERSGAGEKIQVNARTWKAWLVPGGLLLALAVALVNSPLFVLVAPSLSFYYAAVFVAGLLLAWRFNSSRVLFSLLVLLLAHRAIDFFAAGQLSGPVHGGPGRMAVTLSALLIPLNFVVFASMRERGLSVAGVVPRFGVVFLESVIFAVLCRPENSPGNGKAGDGSGLPIWVWLSFAVATAVLGWRFFQTRKPIEPGFAWCVAAVFLWLEFAPVGKMSDAYVATAALILGASLIETSYVLAYHDELTGIRGRRAFNESLLSLDQQYAIAIVDIDHFKKFNDTYGHDVGDQVLCMVASRLSQVEGNGQAFRCGGEEFAIVFRNLSAKEALEHLDVLRRVIEKSTFQLRAGDRRAESQVEKINERRAGESDRRRSTKKKAAAAIPKSASDRLSVTVSIGVAEPSTRNRQPEQVIQAADQALYRAKGKGRNRVELASLGTPRIVERKGAKSSRG
jgi:diguanylate cyclase (GGDEF)-like protein